MAIKSKTLAAAVVTFTPIGLREVYGSHNIVYSIDAFNSKMHSRSIVATSCDQNYKSDDLEKLFIYFFNYNISITRKKYQCTNAIPSYTLWRVI